MTGRQEPKKPEKRSSHEAKLMRARAHASPADSSLTNVGNFGDMVQINPAPDASAPPVPTGVYREFKVCR